MLHRAWEAAVPRGEPEAKQQAGTVGSLSLASPLLFISSLSLFKLGRANCGLTTASRVGEGFLQEGLVAAPALPAPAVCSRALGKPQSSASFEMERIGGISP